MTTAARPTFAPARGGQQKGENDLSALSKQYSSRDLPSHMKLKYREKGQGTSEDLRGRDFRSELEDRERAAREKRDRDRGRESGSSSSSSSKRPRMELTASNLDADDPVDDEEDEDEDDSEDEDDTAALLAELQKIKKERSQEAAKKEAERKAEEERIRMENIIKGNPLINNEGQMGGDFKVKRRWDDDVVFKNCARGDDGKGKGFINDTLRSEFHKKFMEKYVK